MHALQEGAAEPLALLGLIRLVAYLSQPTLLGSHPCDIVADCGTGVTAIGERPSRVNLRKRKQQEGAGVPLSRTSMLWTRETDQRVKEASRLERLDRGELMACCAADDVTGVGRPGAGSCPDGPALEGAWRDAGRHRGVLQTPAARAHCCIPRSLRVRHAWCPSCL